MAFAAGSGDPMPLGFIYSMAALLGVCGLSFVWLGRKAERGELRRNMLAGIRTKASMSSDAAWDACHRAGGRLLTIAGVVVLVAAVALVVWRPPNGAGNALILVALGLMLVLVVWSGIKGNRAARAVGAPPDRAPPAIWP